MLGGMEVGATLGIAVIHYRTPEVALDCLARIGLAAPGARVVLVDTAPEASFEARVARDFPDVEFLPAVNHSYSHSVNVGLARLGTPYVALMNADVMVERSTFEDLRAVLDAQPDCGVVGPLARTGTGELQSLGLPYRRHYRALAALADEGATSPSVPVGWLSGCLQLLTEEAWRASGGYDETLRFFNEDMEFCFRLGRLGYGARLVATPVVHIGGSSTPPHPAFHVEGRRGGMVVSRRYRSRAFQALHLAFLWGEALLGKVAVRDRQKLAAHQAMLEILRSGAWERTPFGATLDQRGDW